MAAPIATSFADGAFAWAIVHKTVTEFLQMPDNVQLFYSIAHGCRRTAIKSSNRAHDENRSRNFSSATLS